MIFRKAAVLLLLTAALLNLMVAVGYLLMSGVVTGAEGFVAAVLAGAGGQVVSITVGQALLFWALYSVVTILVVIAALRHRMDRSAGFVLFAAMLLLVIEAIDAIYTGIGANVIGIAAGIVTAIALVARKQEMEPNPIYEDRMVGLYGDDNTLKLIGGLFYGGIIICVAGILFTMESLLRASPYDQFDYARMIREFAERSGNQSPAQAAAPAQAEEKKPYLFAGGAEDEPADVARMWADSEFSERPVRIVKTGSTIADGRQYLDFAIYESSDEGRGRLLRRIRVDMEPDGWKVRAQIGPLQLWEARPATLPKDNAGRCVLLAARFAERVFAERWPDDLPEKLERRYRDTWFNNDAGFGQVAVQLSTRDNFLGHTLRFACRKVDGRLTLTEISDKEAFVDRSTGEITVEQDL